MLTITILLLPLFFSLVLFIIKGLNSKYLALFASIITASVTLYTYFCFDNGLGVQFLVDIQWQSYVKSSLSFGIDGLNMIMLLLVNLLSPIIIFSSFKDNRPSCFYALILLMQFGLIGVFTSLDAMLFYVFWEITLIPIWFICGIFGQGENKLRINTMFFVYTFVGSLFMFIALIYIYLHVGSFSLEQMYSAKLSQREQIYIFWMFFLAFGIKLPIFPLHSWQANTYTSSPTQGSMLLSGLMLKMGVFGMIKYMMPMTPLAVVGLSGKIALILCVISIIYASLIAISQVNIKRMIAFSSMSHVGLIAAGILASFMNIYSGTNDNVGIQGASFQMIAHGVNVIGLFYVADVLYKKFGTYNLNEMGGLASKAPIFSVMFMVIIMGTMAIPLTNGFIGEFLLLKGLYDLGIVWVIFGGLTLIFCAVYMLKMYGNAMFGKGDENALKLHSEAPISTLACISILCIFIILLGVYPNIILNTISNTISSISSIY